MTGMLLDEYQENAARFARYPSDVELDYLIHGLTSEAGEVAGLWKKQLRLGVKTLPTAEDISLDHKELHGKAVRELGDVLWYVSQLARRLGVSLSEVALSNLEKLEGRAEQGMQDGLHRHSVKPSDYWSQKEKGSGMSLENTNAAVEALLREKHMVALLKERIAVLEGQLASGAGDVIEAVNKTSEIFRSVRDERDALRAQVDRDQKQILELQDQTSEMAVVSRDLPLEDVLPDGTLLAEKDNTLWRVDPEGTHVDWFHHDGSVVENLTPSEKWACDAHRGIRSNNTIMLRLSRVR